MRKYIKTELLSIVEQLNKANDVLQKNAGVLSEEQVASVMSECQQSAIAMGNKIESLEGEGTETVRLLEEYCELVYFLTFNWKQQSVKIEKKIRILLNKISNSIRYDLPDSKREVVFLPYKAAMWDSMESVWLAAREDKSCESYVIPIPYFDKNPDGTLKEVHYEGDLYPDYVPITNYNDYDFRERRPDVIFIHNPYDEWNHVTSVHPFFYSKNLKQFTDKLVYIPYFVHQNEKVKEEYCVLPGTVYADLVVLQSEKVREKYIKVFSDEMKGNSEANSKFVALGSPKFDYKNGEKTEVPIEWIQMIYQGSKKKKVIFFNTHLVNLMQKYNNTFFSQIEKVFATFRSRQDVLLLWRPHPLSVETAQMVNAQIAEQYLKLVERYKKEAWGIFDDSPDLHRAIELSDAYYGNYSSVAELFKQAGKPVMIMNLTIK